MLPPRFAATFSLYLSPPCTHTLVTSRRDLFFQCARHLCNRAPAPQIITPVLDPGKAALALTPVPTSHYRSRQLCACSLGRQRHQTRQSFSECQQRPGCCPYAGAPGNCSAARSPSGLRPHEPLSKPLLPSSSLSWRQEAAQGAAKRRSGREAPRRRGCCRWPGTLM
jgi:hypothetical protein